MKISENYNIGVDISQKSTKVDEIIKLAQKPFEESVRMYLELEKAFEEVNKMRNLK